MLVESLKEADSKLVCMPNIMIGHTVINYIVEFHHVNCNFVGGIPARGGGYHVQPHSSAIVEKKPYRTEIMAPARLERLINNGLRYVVEMIN